MPDAMNETEYRQPPVNERGRAYDPDTTDDERTYALFMHLSLLAHIVLTFFALAIPIIMWQIKKNESPFLDDHGREALNFQISVLIWSIALPILVTIFGVLTCGVGLVLLIPAALFPYIIGLIGMIQASLAANRGEFYRYPMTFRFV